MSTNIDLLSKGLKIFVFIVSLLLVLPITIVSLVKGEFIALLFFLLISVPFVGLGYFSVEMSLQYLKKNYDLMFKYLYIMGGLLCPIFISVTAITYFASVAYEKDTKSLIIAIPLTIVVLLYFTVVYILKKIMLKRKDKKKDLE